MAGSNRSAVITGGSAGIGFATAQALSRKGYTVFIAGRDQQRGDAAAAELRAGGADARFIRTDVSQDKEVAALASEAAQAGPIDAWFNNAGVEGIAGPLAVVDDDAVRELFDINLKGVYSGLRHSAEHMAEGGVIVNNASFVGVLAPVPIAVAYGATKAAVVSMTRSAAIGLADQGISVFAVCPFIVDTPMLDRLTGGAGPEARAGFAAQFAPSGKLTEPGEVADVVASLVSGERNHPSGTVLTIDAGSVEILGA